MALNIDEILKAHPPQINEFSKWKLLYFVHLVLDVPPKSKKERSVKCDYVNLSSVKMQRVVPNYKEYILYLVDRNILFANERYSNHQGKRFAKSYKLTSTYSTSPICKVPVDEIQFAKRIQSAMKMPPADLRKINREYSHLIRQFAGLEYNYELAMNHIKEMKVQTLNADPHFDELEAEDRIREITRNNELLRDKQYGCMVDRSSGRFHSVITRLKREFRYFLTYKGQSLVSLDLKCSQPYLAQRLLSPKFWLQPAGGGKEKPRKPGPKPKSSRAKADMLTMQQRQAADSTRQAIERHLGCSMEVMLKRNRAHWGIGVWDIEERLHEEVRGAMGKVKKHSPMLVCEIEHTDCQSITAFSELVNSGDIYLHILERLKVRLDSDVRFQPLYDENVVQMTRDSMKKLVLRGMYSPHTSINPTTKLIHLLFKEEFSGVEAIFNHIKSQERAYFKVLALLLQALESELILNRVCKRIAQHNRHIPFFTIHDCILTTPIYQDDVKKIIEEVFMEAIHAMPRIDVKSYALSDMTEPAGRLTKDEENSGGVLDEVLKDTRLYGEEEEEIIPSYPVS